MRPPRARNRATMWATTSTQPSTEGCVHNPDPEFLSEDEDLSRRPLSSSNTKPTLASLVQNPQPVILSSSADPFQGATATTTVEQTASASVEVNSSVIGSRPPVQSSGQSSTVNRGEADNQLKGHHTMESLKRKCQPAKGKKENDTRSYCRPTRGWQKSIIE